MAAGGGEKLEGLQALRALAALAVVVFHAGRYVAETLPPAAWRWGEFGVGQPTGAGWAKRSRRTPLSPQQGT